MAHCKADPAILTKEELADTESFFRDLGNRPTDIIVRGYAQKLIDSVRLLQQRLDTATHERDRAQQDLKDHYDGNPSWRDAL